MSKEVRKLDDNINFIDNRKIEGYALIFNSFSEDLGGFREIILPESLDGIIEKSDVFALLNHEQERGILARSKYGEGTLKLEVDNIGLKYSFDAPHTSLGEEVLEHIKLRNITTSSFGFFVDKDKITKNEKGEYIRSILKFGKIVDVSPVYQPAYQSTIVECNCRSLEDFKESEIIEKKKEIELRLEEERNIELEKLALERIEKEKEKNELEKYYSNLSKKIIKK